MQQRDRILYLITSTNAGGTEKALLELIRRLDRNRYVVLVCSVKRPGAFSRALAAQADAFYSLGLGEAGGLRAVVSFVPALIRLVFLLHRLKPRILHSFLFRANMMGRLAGALTGVPAVISSVRVIEARKPLKHFADRLTSSLVDAYTAVSEATRSYTLKQTGIAPEKITTIYNGIECRTGCGDKAAAPGGRNIALVGRLDRQKGHAVLIQALTMLVPHEPETRAFFFGEGPDEKKLRGMVETAGLARHVIFKGVVENMSDWIARMDIIVLPSLWEGLPNVLLEAMAAGRPVVASRIAGVDEVVIDGQTGILCPPGDAAALARALLGLMRDTALARRMGHAGNERVRTHFPMERTVRATMRLYQGLVGGTNEHK